MKTKAKQNRFADLIHHDAASGVLLMTAALLALILDNSPLAWLYDALLNTPVSIQIGALEISKPLLLWINDGLMAVFFFVIGLEIKRELIEGRLSTWQQASLPLIGAIGGMLAPALVYLALNANDPTAINGWAIPAATDIAFALGVLALLGNRVPAALKVFLLALAIIDDLGAIVIIAVFYTAELSLESLGIGAIGAVILVAMNRFGVTRTAPYILIGIVMWVCVLKSGVHATLAGVIVALTIPLRVHNTTETPPLRRLEHALHPWVAFGIMPIFAFANAGVHLIGLSLDDLLAPIPLGIALGLLIGKQIGILGFAWLGTVLGLCRLPVGVTWMQAYGVALLAGIGFTMSLFIGTLAFSDPEHAQAVRIGVLAGSAISGTLAYIMLRVASQPPQAVSSSVVA